MDFPKLSLNTTWYYQLQGTLNLNLPAKVYDVDLFDTSVEEIQQLKKEGKIVICYFSAGTFENWRPDADKFTKDVIGNPLTDWEGEYWLDIRSSLVRKIMKERLELAKNKGCDGVEPDNVDAYLHNTGFNLTYKDQFDYNRFLAIEAKKLGLLVGLKNDLEQIKDLVDYFDFAINEQCHQYHECDKLKPFIEEDKPVFNVEYDKIYVNNQTAFKQLCNQSKEENIRTIVLSPLLDGSIIKSCDW
ncbi:MAG: endo alpha-1,4 polygalactosaminidase [Thermodesulfobacteria bacterium]|nr:endo alpha-1,4 polygalactosaminidase [Thermodesulfobacteriota bacterium]